MKWNARQVAMLREMGITAWERRDGDPAPLAPETEAAPAEVVQAPASFDEPSTPPAAMPTSAPSAPETAAREGRSADIAGLQWPELRAAVATCTACKLCESRRNTVFGVGNEQADWMIVGEAPGENEDRQGEPFVGQAGKLLDNMLHAIGLTRDNSTPDKQVFIANVLKCRPPSNRNPQPEEVAKCEPFLRRQVELVQPKIILAMGRFALQTLLQTDEPVGRLRGRVHRYQGVPVIVTYHPAYLLRNLTDKAKAWEDLCLALDTIRKS